MVLVFVSSTFESNRKDELRRVIPTVKRTLAMLQVLSPDTVFFGCTTGDDISPNPNSDGVNADSKVSATIAVAHLPAEAKIDVTHFAKRDDFSLDWRQSQWLEKLNFPTSSTTTDNLNKENDNDDNNNSSSSSSSGSNNNTNDAFQFVLYTPEFIDATYDLLKGLDFALPGTRKLGCAAGKVNPLHETQLFYSEVDTSKSINSEKDPMCQGALVITVHTQNTFTVDVSVAQGARPLGPLMEVLEVRDEGNEITVVKEVNTATETRAAPMQLLDMWVKTDIVSLDDGRLAAKYLLMGTEVETLYFNFPPPSKETTTTEQSKKSEDKSSSSSSPPLPSPAEQDPVMLSRKVTGFNESRKSIGVEGDPVRLGTRVQFQIRDEQGATQELARLVDRLSLENSVRAADGLTLMGAIVLADAERGEALYGSDNADMDYRAYKERFMVPVAVVTSQGQIGPLPSGGLLMPGVGDSFMLSASTVYVSIYGQTGVPVTAEDSG